MRIKSINEVNINQHNPFIPKDAGTASAGKRPGLSFAECLNIHSQQKSAPFAISNADSQMAGFFWGFFPTLKVQSKQDLTLEDSAS